MGDAIARVASGHAETTRAAADVLADGGNAVDALIAAAWTACVAEPVLCSPGGGGHALVRGFGRGPVIADFFTQTPRAPRADGADFYPIQGNFGADLQEFHVGLGSAAVPGMVAGLFELHARFGRLPMPVLAGPAAELARAGLVLNPVQAEALRILEPIVRATPAGARAFGLPTVDAPLPGPGDRVANPALAGFMEWIARAGPDGFYRGDVGLAITAMSLQGGGHLTAEDLAAYRVRWRRPMQWRLGGDTRVWSNPPPAFGGLMVALMTGALADRLDPAATFGSAGHLDALTGAMRLSDAQRGELERPDCLKSSRVLMQRFRHLGAGLRARRGTTHIGVRDRDGNLAGMTLSNGEGCGHAVPDCGFMLNNMLGEEDLNRLGFHQWPRNRRLSSMMAPTLVERGGRRLLLGSGGSNRIRTAIAQVLCNVMQFGMPLEAAVEAPRLHLERERLAVEPGWPAETDRWLARHYPRAVRWPGRSLYFGGVHAVADDAQAADPRRSGAAWASGRA
jgi:gamma-glutamyltranspeptidase/glutathione hydrolase